MSGTSASAAYVVLLTLLWCSGLAPAFASTRTLDFDVFLDGDPMGTHRYTLARSGDRVKVTSEAAYRVKVLMITAWRYEHRSVEVWLKGCLRSIDSTTDENGTDYHVTGKTTAAGFAMTTQAGPRQATGCVRTFAYWLPELHESQELLNAQTGTIEPVTITALEARPAPRQKHFAGGTVWGIRGKDIEIDVWQDDAGQWYGLSSKTPEGRLIEYVRRETGR